MCGIYKIENLKNGKVYVGQSRNIEKRWAQHCEELKKGTHHNKHLQRAYDKYGTDAFRFSIVEECDLNDLDSREMYYIKQYNAFTEGYNQTLGGCGIIGYRKEESVKSTCKSKLYQIDSCLNIVKIWDTVYDASSTLKLDHERIVFSANPNTTQKKCGGYFWVYESDMLDGKISDDYFLFKKCGGSIRVSQYTTDMKLVKIYESASQAARELNIASGGIEKVCKGKANSCFGYIWRYTDSYDVEDYEEEKDKIHKIGNTHPVLQFDSKGNFVAEYSSIIDATKSVQGNRCAISRSCQYLNVKASGYYWRYKDTIPDFSPDLKIDVPKQRIRPVIQKSVNGETIACYVSAAEAGRKIGVNKSQISRACRESQLFRGFYWEYKEV